MLTRLYRIEHKSRKWYRRVFFWVIGAATTNAWLLYRRHQTLTAGTSKTLDLLAFSGSICTSLCLAKKPMEMSRRGRKSHQSADAPPCPIRKPKIITRSKREDIRLDQTSHWPVYNAERKRCKLCKNIIQVSCGKCGVYFCFNQKRNCYTVMQKVRQFFDA
ncbi:PiggyBac transposable element-derived protein 2 [Trichinella zimbabwensis]|uniref:PiggyBac transposable element-derived protein 2 n=1 Tax=Trichinella zimbabwensis TaxID=268475 RepID=A0A0V1GTM5_9BILA|nr:PiggyBac transposable element-derived protein 2 [Trichinella zimbabwensis]